MGSLFAYLIHSRICIQNDKSFKNEIWTIVDSVDKMDGSPGWPQINKYNGDPPTGWNDNEISQLVSELCTPEEITVSCYVKNPIVLVVFSCCTRRLLGFNVEKSIQYVKSTVLIDFDKTWIPSKPEIQFITNYKPPLRVLFCGTREGSTAVCFEDFILFEFKQLPLDSVIVHGGCKGIDLFVNDLAKEQNIKTESFPVTSAEWNELGLAAGPLRNQKMLETRIDYVIAFHPDIIASKGTKDMMNRAWRSEIPVYIHDLKRKSKFNGDFTTL